MPSNRRLKRQKKDVSNTGAYFAVALQGKTKLIEASKLEAVIVKALTEAYGIIGGAQYEWTVQSAKKIDDEIQAVLHVPHAEHRGNIWTALTMLNSFNGKPVHLFVSTTSDTVEGLKL